METKYVSVANNQVTMLKLAWPHILYDEWRDLSPHNLYIVEHLNLVQMTDKYVLHITAVCAMAVAPDLSGTSKYIPWKCTVTTTIPTLSTKMKI